MDGKDSETGRQNLNQVSVEINGIFEGKTHGCEPMQAVLSPERLQSLPGLPRGEERF